MTLEEYINYANGQQIEAGGSGEGTLYQCVDLANDYLEKVLGLPKILWTDARDFITKGVARGDFEQVSYPEPGDIAVWQWPPYGHIAIYIGNGQYLTQNYPIALRTTIAILPMYATYMRKKGLIMGQYEDIMAQLKVIDEAFAEVRQNIKNIQDWQKGDLTNALNTLNDKIIAVGGQPTPIPQFSEEEVGFLKKLIEAIKNLFK